MEMDIVKFASQVADVRRVHDSAGGFVLRSPFPFFFLHQSPQLLWRFQAPHGNLFSQIRDSKTFSVISYPFRSFC